MSANKWLLVPLFGLAAALIFFNKEESTSEPSEGKESYYLLFNKDETFKNLIATEGHFRNVKALGVDTEGFLNCAVKHLADAEGHLDEAVSHSLIVEGKETSEKFRELRNDVREFRHDLQGGTVTSELGIIRVRSLRHQFEGFNPELDVSRCKSCEIRVEVLKEGVPQSPFLR